MNPNELFVAHLQHLNQLGVLDVTLLYQTIVATNPWPKVDDVPLSVPALIVFTLAGLVQRLAPDTPAGSHPEVKVIGQTIGIVLSQEEAISTVARIAAGPTLGTSEAAVLRGEGMRRIGKDILGLMKMDYGMSQSGLMIVEGEGDGEAETPRSQG